MEGTRVLIVEDNAADLSVLMGLLEKASFADNVKILTSRALATQYLDDESQKAEDLIAVFIDMHFPSMGGIQLLKRIRRTDRLSHLRVIMMTASNSASDLQMCSDIGIFSYVRKPITQASFISSVANIFNPRDTTKMPDLYFPG